MGSIVKSIGKTIKKIGKGLKKVIKKIGPALLVAAAVYAGVAFYGASITGASGIGTANFSAGLKGMGQKLMGFFSPTGAAPVAGQGVGAAAQYGANIAGTSGIVPTMGEQAAATYAGGNVLGEFATATAVTPGSATAFMANPALTNVVKGNIIKSYSSAIAGGMTSGDALVYMTKMNMLATGVKMVAGFFDKSEEEQRQHEKELLSMRYAFGKPMTDEQKAFKAEHPDWISQHAAMQPQDLYSSPNQMQTQMYSSLPTQATSPSPYVQQQTIGQPTLGRQKAGQYGPRPQQTFTGTTPGLIKQGTQSFVDPRKQGYV